MGTEMDTFSARLASFDIVLRPEKRRSSNTKGPNAIAWPHDSPSPAELAHAGFYYKPYESNPDNTTCFHCNRALDGWEEDDNPITEHLKHSPNCGWAIMMDIQQSSSNPAKIEDPTSERITQARISTFGTSWPHDGKKGWMVESGWYFCPNDESDDLASCAYCKLSLDGWEPKDDPYDEHYRRSSDCSFFVFANPPGKKGKGTRGKKSRTSKTSSRLSTQSVTTTASEAPEIDADMDIDMDEMDQSMMSQSTSKPKSTKKGTKSKGKSAKSKKEDMESESQMDVDSMDIAQPKPEAEPEPPKPKRGGRGKKRVSEEISREEPEPVVIQGREHSPAAEPPSKRRNTRARSSSVSRNYDYEQQVYDMHDTEAAEEPRGKETKKSRKGSKKTTSKTRIASDASASSKTTSKERLPRDSELDAAIEAGLEAEAHEPAEQLPENMPEPEAKLGPEQEPEPEPEPEPAPRALKRFKTSKKSKATAKSSEPPQEAAPQEVETQVEKPQHQVEPSVDIDAPEEDGTEEPTTKTKSGKSSKKKEKSTKKSKKQEAKAEKHVSRESTEPKSVADDKSEHEHHDSFVSVEIVNQKAESHSKPEEESEEKPATKKSSRKKDEKLKKSRKAMKEPSPVHEPEIEPEFEPEPEVQDEPKPEPELEAEPEAEPESELELEREPTPKLEAVSVDDQHDIRSPSADMDEEFATPGDIDDDQVEMIQPPHPSSPASRHEKTPVPPKTAKRYSDIPQEEHLAESFNESQNSRAKEERTSKAQRASNSSNRAVSPLPPQQSTPSMSPQSSDAENRPPSSRPSASRPPLSSTPKQPKARTALPAATPSPSKRNPNAGFPASGHPWTPVDIDELLYGDASDKENGDLSGLFNGLKNGLTSPEKKMSVEQWIMWNAKNGEERLKRECERLVSQFEQEGSRAMRRLEAIECMD
ncbi:hypothetical protein N7532_011378 [Penicillium argentinense]|uniref:Chromosome segregation protein BIR1 n=1 Tax=Penicillium argentinense TaxID=1131581 RepID=A0A9W9JUW8_9EURO|nr:uncharacterized protein N7532_011378 [Penicillium argentinense]KAJ5082335.1 hypothetical protein N7532_011378 [Penicillium argentinense]